MEESLLLLFENIGPFALLLSLLLNILISILGVVPSAFITAANILFFGFAKGLIISVIGEALGAIVSFLIYRKWIDHFRRKKALHHPHLKKLEQTEGSDAFWLILGFRLLPFMPSGVVTFGSALSKVSTGTFAFASTLGKIPSLIIEAGAIYGFILIETKWKITISILLILILIWRILKR